MPLIRNNNTKTDLRANEILEVIMAYARFDFSIQTKITDKADVLDAIAAGVNMLGEELKSSTVSLKEKEQLLREIHHRVKNNMQIISSLLNLLSGNQKNKKFISLIKDCQGRIKAMALIHEMLYATSDFKFTNLLKYIEALLQSLYYSYAPPKNKISFNINIDGEIYFDIDRMIPLGLILNEIICNSLKYAFPNKKGIISIILKKNKKHYMLVASDNGIGLPKTFNKDRNGNLGMQLIFLLSEQLNCNVRLNSKKGTAYTLVLKK